MDSLNVKYSMFRLQQMNNATAGIQAYPASLSEAYERASTTNSLALAGYDMVFAMSDKKSEKMKGNKFQGKKGSDQSKKKKVKKHDKNSFQ